MGMWKKACAPKNQGMYLFAVFKLFLRKVLRRLIVYWLVDGWSKASMCAMHKTKPKSHSNFDLKLQSPPK